MIVRAALNLEVVFGRVDEDGDVVNPTTITFPLGKLCDEEWERVGAEVRAKQAEISAALVRWQADATEEQPLPPPEELSELDAVSVFVAEAGEEEVTDAGD